MRRSIGFGIVMLVCASATAQNSPVAKPEQAAARSGAPHVAKEPAWTRAPYSPPAVLAAPAPYAPAVEAAPAGPYTDGLAPPTLSKVPYVNRLFRNPPAADADQREDHLRKAAEHLEAAGLKDDATRFRSLADEEAQLRKQALLAEKLVQLKALQAEINSLRGAAVDGAQIFLALKVYEVDRVKMKDFGFDGRWFGGERLQTLPTTSPVKAEVLDESDTRLGIFDALVHNQVAKVLSEPTLVTLSGRPASMHVGGEVPVPVQGPSGAAIEYRRVGSKYDVVPRLLDNGKVHLELRVELTDLDHALDVQLGDKTVPGFRSRAVDTAVEIELGSTVVLRGVSHERKESGKAATKSDPNAVRAEPSDESPADRCSELVILVTPTLVPPDAAVKTATRPRPTAEPQPYGTAREKP